MADNTIIIRANEEVIRREFRANDADLMPGYLADLVSTGKVDKHTSASGRWNRMVVLENPYKNTTGSVKQIDTVYAADETVQIGIVRPGVEIYGLVAASASAIVIGDWLESAGDGTVRIITNAADLTGTLTGTANGSLVDVAAAAAATAGSATPSAAQVDTGIATAVAPIVSGVNEQLKELQTKLNAILPNGGFQLVGQASSAVNNSAGIVEARIKFIAL